MRVHQNSSEFFLKIELSKSFACSFVLSAFSSRHLSGELAEGDCATKIVANDCPVFVPGICSTPATSSQLKSVILVAASDI
jgi:hypothetical protein